MITNLSVTNFRAIRGTREYALKEGINTLVGRNEAGKTSAFLAIAYALYGAQAMPDGIDADDLINDHAKECSVTVELTHNGDRYVVKRSQNRSGRGDASLTRNDEDRPYATGRSAVTEAVTALFGVDHSGFLISVFARQKELDALAAKQGAQRISTMLRYIGVDQADSAVKALRKDANEERRRLDVLRAKVGDLDELRSRKESDSKALADLLEQQKKAAGDENTLRAAVVNADLDLEALRPQREAFEAWQRECDAARVKEATAKVRHGDAAGRVVIVPPLPEPPAVEDVDPAAMEKAEARYEECRAEWAATDTAIRNLSNERDSLTDRCEACQRPFHNAQQVAEHRASLNARISELDGKLTEWKQQGETAKDERDRLREQHQRFDQAQRNYQVAVEGHKAAVRRNVESQEQAAQFEQEWQEARGALAAIESDPPNNPTEAIQVANRKKEEAQERLTAASVRVATLEASITGIKASLSRLDADLARADEQREEVEQTEHRLLTLDVAAKEMAAMKERLIGRIIPTLEQRASMIVSELTDGKHTELRLTPDYEIQYVTETGQTRSFANLSGGAQEAFALALRLAIAELRAGSVSFLCLDEVFAAVDSERQGLAWEVIERLGKRYQQILLITHVESLKERAPNLFVVV